MRYLYHTITGLGLVLSSSAQALTFYADALYWQPSESVDWALTNSNISASVEPNQVLSYKTIDFDFYPGFRIGAGFDKEDRITRLLYTRLDMNTSASTKGNVISTFMPSKFSNKFYESAAIKFAIDLNMVDISLLKLLSIDNNLVVNPSFGLRVGSIAQEINTRYINPINMPPATYDPRNVLEHVTNNFTGIGPTLGIEGSWNVYQNNASLWSIFANLLGSYMWGKWSIHDTLYAEGGGPIGSLQVGKRDFGAFTIQGLFGIQLDYKNCTFKAGYEVSDWFDQYQVFDNGSGTHTNDLVLQGLTVAFRYQS